MNLKFPSILPLLLTLMKLFVKTSFQPIFTFLSLMFLPDFSKTSPKRLIFYTNMLSIPLLNKHSFKRKAFLTFLIYNNSAPSKISLIIGSLPIFFKSTTLKYQYFQKLTLNTKRFWLTLNTKRY